MKTKLSLSLFIISLSFIFLYFGCSKDVPVTLYKTQNVIIVVVDGPRLTETWDNSTRQFIPHRSAMLSEGVYCSQFYNYVTTSTNHPLYAAVKRHCRARDIELYHLHRSGHNPLIGIIQQVAPPS